MDRFHQFFRMKQIPILFEVQKTALNNGALMSTLSGSGSTFFNLCFKEDTQTLKKVLSDKFSRLKVLSLKFDNFGVVFDDEFKF